MKKTASSDPTQDEDLEISGDGDVITITAGDTTLEINVSPATGDLEITANGTTTTITSA